MRRAIRTQMGPGLSLAQKKQWNAIQMKQFLNKNAACRTINGEWVQELTL